MSKSENTTTSTSLFAIVRKISSLLKLGNDGKLDSFLTRVIKVLTKEVSILKRNLDTTKLNYDQNIDDLNDKLVDAQEALTNSYHQIDIDKIGTNESQNTYVEVYLDNIDRNTLVVKKLEKQIESTKEEYLKYIDSANEQIDSLNKRISIISSEK